MGRDPQYLLDGLMKLHAAGQPMRVSVFAMSPDDGSAHEDVLLDVCRAAHAKWGKVQVSTVERLEQAGFALLDERADDERDCHFHVAFSPSVTLEDAERFIRCFGEPVENPVPRAERNW